MYFHAIWTKNPGFSRFQNNLIIINNKDFKNKGNNDKYKECDSASCDFGGGF